jgi:hypothetical protein
MFQEKNGIKLYVEDEEKDRRGAREEAINVDL